VGMIDTAHLYTGGESERVIGEAAAGVSHTCLVATKGGYQSGDPATLAAEVEQSLKSLNVESIDLYYLHRVDAEIPIEESVGTLKTFHDQGRIQHIGLSQVDVVQIERARKVAPISA